MQPIVSARPTAFAGNGNEGNKHVEAVRSAKSQLVKPLSSLNVGINGIGITHFTPDGNNKTLAIKINLEKPGTEAAVVAKIVELGGKLDTMHGTDGMDRRAVSQVSYKGFPVLLDVIGRGFAQ